VVVEWLSPLEQHSTPTSKPTQKPVEVKPAMEFTWQSLPKPGTTSTTIIQGEWLIHLRDAATSRILASRYLPVVELHTSMTVNSAVDSLIQRYWSVDSLCLTTESGRRGNVLNMLSLNQPYVDCKETQWSSLSEKSDIV